MNGIVERLRLLADVARHDPSDIGRKLRIFNPLVEEAADEIERLQGGSAAPCGSWRVLRYIEGNEADVRWCERTNGPCPFPGSLLSRYDDEHKCAKNAEDFDPNAPWATPPNP